MTQNEKVNSRPYFGYFSASVFPVFDFDVRGQKVTCTYLISECKKNLIVVNDPGGRIDPQDHNDPKCTAIRELYEESGILLNKNMLDKHFDLSADGRVVHKLFAIRLPKCYIKTSEQFQQQMAMRRFIIANNKSLQNSHTFEYIKSIELIIVSLKELESKRFAYSISDINGIPRLIGSRLKSLIVLDEFWEYLRTEI